MLAVELPLVEVPTEKFVFVVGSSVCVVGSVVCCVALLLIGDVLVKIETPLVLVLSAGHSSPASTWYGPGLKQ